MFFGQNRDQLRRFYLEAWRKFQHKEPMQPLEAMIGEVIAQHPEYHALLQDEEKALSQEFSAESGQSNPFMHMGMHLGLREQLTTRRPSGIELVYAKLSKRLGDAHEAEHLMMECLGQAMWQAQQTGIPPNEEQYLECLQRL